MLRERVPSFNHRPNWEDEEDDGEMLYDEDLGGLMRDDNPDQLPLSTSAPDLSPPSSPSSSSSPRFRPANLPFPTRIPQSTSGRSRAGSASSANKLNSVAASPSLATSLPSTSYIPDRPPGPPRLNSNPTLNQNDYPTASQDPPYAHVEPPSPSYDTEVDASVLIRDEVAPFRIVCSQLLDPSSGRLEFGKRDRFTEMELLRQTPLAAVDPLTAMGNAHAEAGVNGQVENGRDRLMDMELDGETDQDRDRTSREEDEAVAQQQYSRTPSPKAFITRATSPESTVPLPSSRMHPISSPSAQDMRRRALSSNAGSSAPSSTRTPSKNSPVSSGLASSPRQQQSTPTRIQSRPSPASSSNQRIAKTSTPSSSSATPSPRKTTPRSTTKYLSSTPSRIGNNGLYTTPKKPRAAAVDDDLSSYRTSQMFGGEDAIPPPSSESSFSKMELRNWDEVVLPTVRRNLKRNPLDDWEEPMGASPVASPLGAKGGAGRDQVAGKVAVGENGQLVSKIGHAEDKHNSGWEGKSDLAGSQPMPSSPSPNIPLDPSRSYPSSQQIPSQSPLASSTPYPSEQSSPQSSSIPATHAGPPSHPLFSPLSIQQASRSSDREKKGDSSMPSSSNGDRSVGEGQHESILGSVNGGQEQSGPLTPNSAPKIVGVYQNGSKVDALYPARPTPEQLRLQEQRPERASLKEKKPSGCCSGCVVM